MSPTFKGPYGETLIIDPDNDSPGLVFTSLEGNKMVEITLSPSQVKELAGLLNRIYGN